MNGIFKNKKWWKIGLLIFAVYTFYFLIRLPQVQTFQSNPRMPVSYWFFISRLALDVYIWALLTPAVLWLGEKFPIKRGNTRQHIPLHVLFGLSFGVIQPIAYHFGLMLIMPITVEKVFAILLHRPYIIEFLTRAFLHYVVILSVHQAYLYFRESQERELQLKKSELQTLKAQLHPHFLFNALNAISALVHSSPDDADETLTQLSDLLRASLKDDKTQEITLREELEFLRIFLQIHKILMKKRLEVEWDIGDETLEAMVPNMVLQPLVENSIQHGLAPLARGGRLEIAAARSNGHLSLTVRDNGRGLSKKDLDSESGIGLPNTRERLEHLYGDAHEFMLAEPETGGVTVNIKIPFRENPVENN